jgi:ABC-2 type transport system ATP-binding protein
LARERNAVRRRLGVVFQAPALDRKLTVRENLRHQGHLYGLRGKDLEARIEAGLERFRLADRRDQLVERLSGGLRRRVEIAKGLLHRPELLVLDEPSTGLDPGARRDLWRVLDEIRGADGVTVLLTSHILEEVERCDRVAILDRGRIVTVGSPGTLEAELGGDVISITCDDPQALSQAIATRFGIETVALERTVRIERAQSPDLVRELLDAFRSDIEAVTLSKPTLEDVFIHVTGHGFWSAGGAGTELPGESLAEGRR